MFWSVDGRSPSSGLWSALTILLAIGIEILYPPQPELHFQKKKKWNLSSFQCPRDGVGETTKPIVISMSQKWSGHNHETTIPGHHKTFRHFDVPEMEWAKPWNLSSFQCPWDGVGETMKPRNLLSFRCPRNGMGETTKPWNLLSFRCPRNGVGKTMKPRNQSSFRCPRDAVGKTIKTTKPQNLLVSWFHGEISQETMKPWNHGFIFSNVSWLVFIRTLPNGRWCVKEESRIRSIFSFRNGLRNKKSDYVGKFPKRRTSFPHPPFGNFHSFVNVWYFPHKILFYSLRAPLTWYIFLHTWICLDWKELDNSKLGSTQ